MRPPRRGGGAAVVGVLAVLLAACGGSAAAPAAAGTDGAPSGEVLVFAAASLTDAFEAIAADVEADHPGLDVVLNLAGSQQLAGQIVAGAPADVFASADARQMAIVADAGLLDGEPAVLATNTLAIAVEPGNPLGIGGLQDLARPELTVVLAAEAVPAGRYAAEALRAAGVTVAPASREPDVRAVLGKVALGEADAGVVYRSDVVAAGDDVDAVTVPGTADARATYPIAALADAPNPAGAAAFVAAVTSPSGQEALADAGFGPS